MGCCNKDRNRKQQLCLFLNDRAILAPLHACWFLSLPLNPTTLFYPTTHLPLCRRPHSHMLMFLHLLYIQFRYDMLIVMIMIGVKVKTTKKKIMKSNIMFMV